MAGVYLYRTAGWHPPTVCAWSAALGVAGYGLSAGGAAALWPVAGVSALGLAAHVLRHPRAGCRIGPELWLLHHGRRRTRLRLADIARVELGPGTPRACLKDGSLRSLPAAALPPAATLARCLARHAIPCTGPGVAPTAPAPAPPPAPPPRAAAARP